MAQEVDMKFKEKARGAVGFNDSKVVGSDRSLQPIGGNSDIQSGKKRIFNLVIHFFKQCL